MTSARREQIVESLRDKEYRDAVVEAEIETGLPFQIEATREARGWTQRELADRYGTKQAQISRLESLDYGRYSLATLKRLASVFDVALVVRFVPFSRLVDEMIDLSPENLAVPDFAHDAELARAPVRLETAPAEGLRKYVRSTTAAPLTGAALRVRQAARETFGEAASSWATATPVVAQDSESLVAQPALALGADPHLRAAALPAAVDATQTPLLVGQHAFGLSAEMQAAAPVFRAKGVPVNLGVLVGQGIGLPVGSVSGSPWQFVGPTTDATLGQSVESGSGIGVAA